MLLDLDLESFCTGIAIYLSFSPISHLILRFVIVKNGAMDLFSQRYPTELLSAFGLDLFKVASVFVGCYFCLIFLNDLFCVLLFWCVYSYMRVNNSLM